MPKINQKINNNCNFIGLLSDFLQFYNTSLLQEDASNNDLMKELQNQNTNYFERIIKKLDNIEKRLERLENDAR